MRITNTGRRLKTTETSLAVVEALQKLDGARVTELADYLNTSKSTVHNHLSTLRKNGYVVLEGDEYNLGLQFANLGTYAQNRKSGYDTARELSEAVAESTGLESDFIVEENGRGVYLETEARSADQNLYPHVGDWMYLHSVAAGKAILAEYTDDQVEQIIDRWGLPKQTENTITDASELFAELETVREEGYAFNRGENNEGVRAVGTAVRDGDGTLLGAVSVSGPSYRMSGEWFEQNLPQLLVETVEEYEEDP
jgi:DNA-binding IclR family transcriptional regulator